MSFFVRFCWFAPLFLLWVLVGASIPSSSFVLVTVLVVYAFFVGSYFEERGWWTKDE